MGTEQQFIDFVSDQLKFGERLTHRKMFGEYALYLDGKVIGFACDNSLFIKPSAAAERLGSTLPQQPPYPGAKNYPVADEWLDDVARLRELIEETAELMPPPKAKKPAAKKPAAKPNRTS